MRRVADDRNRARRFDGMGSKKARDEIEMGCPKERGKAFGCGVLFFFSIISLLLLDDDDFDDDR